MTLRIGTRASALARWQAEHIQQLLRRAWPALETALVPMTTTGDRILDRPLADIGGKGLFVKELEHAMLAGEIDIAVHSLKDMPTEQPPGLLLDVVIPRASAFDVLCGREEAYRVDTLPQGASVGTGSQRRMAQLRRARPDLKLVPLRGNVQTRLEKRHSESLDAIVLAEAGLRRLGIWESTFKVIDASVMLPAPGQGAIVVERRADDARLAELLAPLRCDRSAFAIEAERACLRAVGGDCHTPFAAWASLDEEGWTLHGRLFRGEGYAMTRATRTDTRDIFVAHALGEEVASALLRDLQQQGT